MNTNLHGVTDFRWMACHLCWTWYSSLMLENDDLENVTIGNLPYPTASQMLCFHRPCHPNPKEKLYLHSSQQETYGFLKMVWIFSVWDLEALGWCLQNPPPGSSPLEGAVTSQIHQQPRLGTDLEARRKDFLRIFSLITSENYESS